MDDSHGEIQTQLGSSTAMSQLNLGHITRIPDTIGRADYRGQGFELRTDAHGAIRADKGIYITTYGRAGASAHIKDMGETIGLLKGARSAHKAAAQRAIDHKADERTIDETAQTQLKAQNEQIAGKASGADNSPSPFGRGFGERAEGEGARVSDFPELSNPHLVMSSPAGIALATAQSTHLAAGEHIALTAGQDVSMSVGKRLIAIVAKGIGLYTDSKGINAIAARDKIQIQAQNDEIEIFADQVAKFISAKKSIHIVAKDNILLTAKGSYMKINSGGIEQGTPATHIVHAASYAMVGAKDVDYELPALAGSVFDEGFKFIDKKTGNPIVDYPVWIETPNGELTFAKTDEQGLSQVVTDSKASKIKLPDVPQFEILVD